METHIFPSDMQARITESWNKKNDRPDVGDEYLLGT